LAAVRLATDKKNAIAWHAYVIFIDESGLLMAPLVRRTWALRGHRPVLLQRGRHREKVSIAGALCWAPWRHGQSQALKFVFQTLVDAYYTKERSAAFLEMLMREIPNRLIVVWDGGNMHKGDPIRETVELYRPRLVLEKLPPYAPMLNPVEPLWSWLKYSRLCNAAPTNASELNGWIKRELRAIDDDQDFLRAMWQGSKLPFPRTLLL
jgi:transposase